jgi:hypothetical protein
MDIQIVDPQNFTVSASVPVAYNIDQLIAQKADLQKRIDDITVIIDAAQAAGVTPTA